MSLDDIRVSLVRFRDEAGVELTLADDDLISEERLVIPLSELFIYIEDGGTYEPQLSEQERGKIIKALEALIERVRTEDPL